MVKAIWNNNEWFLKTAPPGLEENPAGGRWPFCSSAGCHSVVSRDRNVHATHAGFFRSNPFSQYQVMAARRLSFIGVYVSLNSRAAFEPST